MNLAKLSFVVTNLSLCLAAPASVRYVDLNSPSPQSPYSDWTTAATNIQDAIDVSATGDVIWVTNGIYANGGRVSSGALTNRVVLDKAVTVQSVNGPAVTIIQGARDPATTNGPLAVRCAWVTNGATLSGFTLRQGATLAYTSAGGADESGGGVSCASSTNAIVANCLLVNNTAASVGGGAFLSLLTNCTITGNTVIGDGNPISLNGSGGGAASCTLRNCLITGNWANGNGGGAASCALKNCAVTKNTTGQGGGGVYSGVLVNCTVTANNATANSSSATGGTYLATLTNCIVYGNRALSTIIHSSFSNYYSGSLRFCCSSPLPNGTGNISADPQLLADGVHLSATSPCRGVGTTAVIFGTDIDGQPWATLPSMGCDEWWPAPAIAGTPQFQLSGVPVFLGGTALVTGQPPFSFWWIKDGAPLDDNLHYLFTHTTNLTVNNFAPADAGGYQIIASNSFGIVTSAVAQVVVHCADPGGVSPVSPFSSWSIAATNLQDAIDAAGWGEFVLATNGLYAAGGRAWVAGLTNRVTVPALITVSSVNGAGSTIIQGAWDPNTTNGPAAVRCVWLADGAVLNGFTLENGATHNGTGTADTLGGGVWAGSANASVMNCVLSNNAAGYGGGACYSGSLLNCRLLANRSGQWGGGSYSSALRNCLISGNVTFGVGGGLYLVTAFNCTVSGNWSANNGGGIVGGVALNSIVYGNLTGSFPPSWYSANYWSGMPTMFTNSCTTPAVSGPGNISSDPQLLDAIHIATTSPCRGAGNPMYSSGIDIDGELWANPPSMGCDEPWEATIAGPLEVGISASLLTVAQSGYDPLFGYVTGRASRVGWDFGDGSVLTNASYLSCSHPWTNPSDYTVTFTAYNADYPFGVSTNMVVHVMPLLSPAISATGFNANTFSLSFPGQPGIRYVVEETTSLTAPIIWSPVMTVMSTGATLQVIDTKATNDARFYRVHSQ